MTEFDERRFSRRLRQRLAEGDARLDEMYGGPDTTYDLAQKLQQAAGRISDAARLLRQVHESMQDGVAIEDDDDWVELNWELAEVVGQLDACTERATAARAAWAEYEDVVE